MGHIKEPKGVDFVISSDPLTDKDRQEISEFIRNYKTKFPIRRQKQLKFQSSVKFFKLDIAHRASPIPSPVDSITGMVFNFAGSNNIFSNFIYKILNNEIRRNKHRS